MLDRRLEGCQEYGDQHHISEGLRELNYQRDNVISKFLGNICLHNLPLSVNSLLKMGIRKDKVMFGKLYVTG